MLKKTAHTHTLHHRASECRRNVTQYEPISNLLLPSLPAKFWSGRVRQQPSPAPVSRHAALVTKSRAPMDRPSSGGDHLSRMPAFMDKLISPAFCRDLMCPPLWPFSVTNFQQRCSTENGPEWELGTPPGTRIEFTLNIPTDK